MGVIADAHREMRATRPSVWWRGPSHSKAGGEGADHVHGGRIAIDLPKLRLAVGGHHAAHPAPEHGPEPLWIEPPQHAQEGGSRRNVSPENQETPQPVGLEPALQGDVLQAVGVTVGVLEHGAHHDHQILPEIVAGTVARLTRSFKLTRFLHLARSRSIHSIRPEDESECAFERIYKTQA